MVGARGPKNDETPVETEVLLEEMEWAGIQGALIGHSTAKEYDPMFGNRLLMRELKKSPRLYGAWALMPHHTGEMPPPRDLLHEMADNGIRAVKMYPRAHRYPFNIDTCGDLFRELADNGVPLMVEGGHLSNPDLLEPSNQVTLSDLDAVLSGIPDLHVVLLNPRWDATRYLHWLMSKHANLSVDLSAHQGNRALEVFTSWFGARRILFGTGALEKSPGALRSFLDYCTLDKESKDLIASGNLVRLLRLEAVPPPYRVRKSRDPILETVKQGKPLRDTPVIDSHAHIAHDRAAGIGFVHTQFSDAGSMVERAQLMGIRASCISGFLAVWTDYDEGNKIVWEAMKRYPRFYHGYASLQPQYVRNWSRELRRVYGRYRMEGMKPYHPRTAIPYNDRLWAPWYEEGNRHRRYALIHPSPNFVAEINDIAPRYPYIAFLIAHSGANYQYARDGVGVALRNPNVYLEITQTNVTLGVIEFMVRHVGAERVLFGTDQPMRDPIPQFGWVAYSHCTPEEKRKIFGLNMRRLIKRVRM